jgi:hypothetical protein
MTRMAMGFGLQRSLMVLATSGVLLSASTGAQANEDGLGGLFQRLFSPEPQTQAVQPVQSAPQAAFSQQRRLPTWRQYYGRRSAQRPEGTRLRPKIRYAALPKPQEPLKIRISDRKGSSDAKIHITDRQVPLNMKDGAAAALLQDKTLRPGDIVVLQDGARVFTGSPDKPHSVKDFESIGRSDFIDRHTRTKLTAMLVPAGAVTLAEARKQLELSKMLPSVTSTPVQVQASAIRVIYPWNSAP